jgi:hypothetical protein
MALTVAHGRHTRSRLHVDLERARGEIALLREELAIKDARWVRVPCRRRPHFSGIQRMRILQVKSARGWSCEEASKVFMVDEQTMRSWLRRADELGGSLVKVCEPVNKFPDFVRHLVRQLNVLVPTMGKVRIAQVLARAGLHLGVTTVGRMLRATGPIPEAAGSSIVITEERVVARMRSGTWTSPRCRRGRDYGCRGRRSRFGSRGRSAGGSRSRSISSRVRW